MPNNPEAANPRPDPWRKEQPEEIAELSEHILNRLIGAGFKTVADVRSAGHDKLREIDGIGDVALAEIMNWLRRLDGDAD